jgi:hypothetical protein
LDAINSQEVLGEIEICPVPEKFYRVLNGIVGVLITRDRVAEKSRSTPLLTESLNAEG